MGHAVRLGVNLSPSQLQSGDLAESVAESAGGAPAPPALLELEVTEDILLEDEQSARDTFRRIQDLGVRIAFDDFGTGYASLSYLKKFPLDGLKIDSSFVLELLGGSRRRGDRRSTITLGKQLGLSVIAEGIENRATADLLASMGCEEGQGYYFGRPMPVQARSKSNSSRRPISPSRCSRAKPNGSAGKQSDDCCVRIKFVDLKIRRATI